MLSGIIYITHFSEMAKNDKVFEIYKQIQIATGQGQDSLSLRIVESPVQNAYNDGMEVVIFRGLLDIMATDDEIALVLGHETAHGMLGHLQMLRDDSSNDDISVLEANADKMGAFYMIRAGYDICKGRELFKYWHETQGNKLGQNHPDMSYRYDELDLNCD